MENYKNSKTQNSVSCISTPDLPAKKSCYTLPVVQKHLLMVGWRRVWTLTILKKPISLWYRPNICVHQAICVCAWHAVQVTPYQIFWTQACSSIYIQSSINGITISKDTDWTHSTSCPSFYYYGCYLSNFYNSHAFIWFPMDTSWGRNPHAYFSQAAERTSCLKPNIAHSNIPCSPLPYLFSQIIVLIMLMLQLKLLMAPLKLLSEIYIP